MRRVRWTRTNRWESAYRKVVYGCWGQIEFWVMSPMNLSWAAGLLHDGISVNGAKSLFGSHGLNLLIIFTVLKVAVRVHPQSKSSESLRWERCVQGLSWKRFEARLVKIKGLRADFFFFFFFPPFFPWLSTLFWGKQLWSEKSLAWKRTTANAACSSRPPAGRPTSPSIRQFDVGWKIRTPPPQQTERGLEQRKRG